MDICENIYSKLNLINKNFEIGKTNKGTKFEFKNGIKAKNEFDKNVQWT